MKKRRKGIIIFWIGMMLLLCGCQAQTEEAGGPAQETAPDVSNAKNLKLYQKMTAVESVPVTIGDTEYEYKDQIRNYLILGTDGRGRAADHPKGYLGDCADFVMVVVINDTKQTVQYLQLSRETMCWVRKLEDVTGQDLGLETMQLCMAYTYGRDQQESAKNMEEAVSYLLGNVPLEAVYSVCLDSVPKINNILGGVTVTIESDFSKVDKSMVQGSTIKLTDEQAEIFVHNRMDVDDGMNQSRMKRHRAYLQGMLQTMEEQMKGDSNYGFRFYNQLKEYAYTDIKGKDVNTLIEGISRYDRLGTVTFEGETFTQDTFGNGVLHDELYLDLEDYKEKMIEVFSLSEL